MTENEKERKIVSPSKISEEFGRQIGFFLFQCEDICKFFQHSWDSTEALHLVLSSKSYFCKEFPKNNRVKAPVISEVKFTLDRPHQCSEPSSHRLGMGSFLTKSLLALHLKISNILYLCKSLRL